MQDGFVRQAVDGAANAEIEIFRRPPSQQTDRPM